MTINCLIFFTALLINRAFILAQGVGVMRRIAITGADAHQYINRAWAQGSDILPNLSISTCTQERIRIRSPTGGKLESKEGHDTFVTSS